MAAGDVVNVWGTGSPQVAGYPPLLPTSVQLSAGSDSLSGSGTPTAGNWLFAIAAWRQDAGVDGVLQYPSTVNIRDDAHNFWMPVSVVPPGTGIARASVWMAPAARVAQYVFVSPTAYQAAMAVEIIEVEADCPWYDVVTVATAYTNQGTAVTCTIEPPSGLFSVGAFAYDNDTLTVTKTGDDWTAQPTVTAEGAGESGDMVLYPFTTTSSGSAMPLEASGNGIADWAEILITVHGVTDAIAFPYQDLMQAGNWPALVTEMACGQVLNANWSFDAGIADWTAESAAISASSLYTFGNSAGSMLVTPSGDDDPGAETGAVPVTPSSTYAMTAWITVPAGWADGALLGVEWFTAAMDEISSSFSDALTVTGSAQELTYSAAAPATAAYAQFSVLLSGTPGDTVLMYVGYAAFAIPGAYGATPDDQLNWTDLSGRTFTKEAIRISRSIQYEQQSLEAGTLEIPLADNDGYLTPGNTQSPYWPYAGDDDVPIRVRAIWPACLTPYSVLYSGFTDDVKVVLDEENLYQYLQVTAADCWSRLTAQMLTAAQQEYLAPIPAGGAGGFWPCDDMAGASAAANLAPTSLGPLAVQNSKFGSDDLVGAFGSTAISLLGDSGGTGGTGWSLSGLAAGKEFNGLSLTLLPPAPASLPPIAGGVAVQLWVYIAPVVDSITWGGSLAACVGVKGVIWSLAVGAPSGEYGGEILMNVYDKTTGDVTTTTVSAGDNWGATLALAVTFTQTTWAVYINSALAGSGDANFAAVYNGVVFNGLNVPWAGLAGYCFNGTVQDIGLYPLTLPETAIVSGYSVASNAELDEPDVSRLARVTGYGGFAPPLAMPGFGGTWPEAGVDPVTQITDTIGQVVSDYYTNIASSTLAMLAVDGTGAIVYRPRGQWYDRPIGIWYLGEHAPLALNVNPDFSGGVESWTATGAALTWVQGAGSGGTLPESYDEAVAADSPAAWWKLAEVAGATGCADSSGNGNTGTPANVTFGEPGPIAGNTLETAGAFNGTSSAVTTSYDPAGLAAFSVEAWVNLQGESVSGNPRIVANSHTDSDGKGFQVMLASSGGHWYPQAWAGNGSANVNAESATPIPVTGWHQIAATWTAGEPVALYVDGVFAADSSALSGTMGTGTAAGTGIGFNPAYDGDYLTGWIAQVSQYTTALPVARVAAHYAAAIAAAPFPQFTGGAAYLVATGDSEVTLTPENQPAAAGETYQVVISVQAPAGYASGAFAEITWLDSSESSISSVSGATIPLVAGAMTKLILSGQAPAGTAFISPSLITYGTPSEGAVIVVGSVVTTDYPGEAPYLRDVRLSNDRAQVFNAAILTQSGTGELTTFSGSTLNFSPTSGITVSAENETSVAQRGNVPYVATIYLQNTEQQIPNVAEFTSNPSGLAFVPAEACMEDFASWVVNTLGAPVLRGDQVTLTPAATWQAMITALQAEIGDTAILNRRQIGAPALELVNYISSLSHEINIADEESPWVTTYQVSPAPSQMVLQCDSPVWGVLDGENLLGW